MRERKKICVGKNSLISNGAKHVCHITQINVRYAGNEQQRKAWERMKREKKTRKFTEMLHHAYFLCFAG